MKKEEDAAKEAFDRTAFAEFLFGPSGRQARAVFLALGVPGDDSDGMKGGVDPSDEAQAPIGGIQADDARADGVEARRQARMGALSMIKSRAPISRRRKADSTLRMKSASGPGAPAA